MNKEEALEKYKEHLRDNVTYMGVGSMVLELLDNSKVANFAISSLVQEVYGLEEQNKKLVEALRFYEDIHEDLLDGGKRARVALKELIMNKSIPCELCCSNIIKGFMTKLKKEDPKDEDRFVCELCVTEIELAQLVWIYDGECK